MDIGAIRKTNEFVKDFLDEYLADGIGAKTKREIDILVMNLLMNYAGLADKSNQELSILLQAPISKIKSLRYEARLKYPPDPNYVKREFLYTLTKSQFDVDKEKITFVVEDEYIRQAIQGQLKAKGRFADTSFNTELVKIDRRSLESVIGELYGEEIAEDFKNGFDEMTRQIEGEDVNVGKVFLDTIVAFAWETAKKLGFEFIKSRMGF